MRNAERQGLSSVEIDKAKAAANLHDGLCQCCETVCGDMCMDHNHETLQFRGILGHRCNKVLGLVHDDSKILERLKRYLDKHPQI